MGKELGLDQVCSELLPADKVAKVEELIAGKPEKAKLAFVGDGINDAPVLSRRTSALPWARWDLTPPSKRPTWC